MRVRRKIEISPLHCVSLHKEWVVKALRAGKHVVIEKPVALNANDYEQMLKEAFKQKRFILDGTMFPHHNRTKAVLDCIVDEEKIGTIDRVEANFTFLTDPTWQDRDIRARKENGDCLGCIGDLGWYCIRYGQLVYGKLGVKAISAQVVDFVLTKHGETTNISGFE
jgi:predicted dehydrogenase